MEKSKTQRSKAVKWAVLWILGIWGFLSFIVLAGEEDPRDPMPFGEFFLIKAVVEKPRDFDPFGQTGLSPFGYNMIDPFGQNSIDHLAHLLL